MRVLVTGANGFVGGAVSRCLLARGVAVRAMVRTGSDRRNLHGLDVDVVKGDLLNPESLAGPVRGVDAVFHVAADYRLWVPDAAPMFAANVDGTRALMLAAADAGVERIVYTSSVATLGLPTDDTLADEDTPVDYTDMIGPYKQSKFRAEAEVRRLIADTGLPAVIVNPSAPVGPGDVKPTPTGRMVVDAASGRLPAYVDTGLNIVHVDDVAEGHWLAFRHGRIGERYVLGGTDMPLAAILADIARLSGRNPPVLRLPHRLLTPLAGLGELWCRVFGGEPLVTLDGIRMARKCMYYSSARARRDLGYTPRPASEALADAVAWFRAAGFVR